MLKLTYNNLIELKGKVHEAMAFPERFSEEELLDIFYRYVDFFNDFRDEAEDKLVDMLTKDDFAVAYSALNNIYLSRD